MNFTFSLPDLQSIAPKFWEAVKGRTVFAFEGEMGAGKTTIIEALCLSRGVKDTMGSPTFSIINEYRYPDGGEEKIIYHMDLYRLEGEQEIVQAGVEDCIYSGAVCMVEWPQKAPFLFDENTVRVYIEPLDENLRSMKIELPPASMAEQS